ncbi:uncharacterized protein LOC134539927 isoform X2 [Bacillus rossius redtenbacheri]|uniref:uncharacterized protein LOC134539927 isoform X2 n=1 Tax=Bacillus rossius redtenbacheri TaxID=93214 RepID=UPI002FDDA248
MDHLLCEQEVAERKWKPLVLTSAAAVGVVAAVVYLVYKWATVPQDVQPDDDYCSQRRQPDEDGGHYSAVRASAFRPANFSQDGSQWLEDEECVELPSCVGSHRESSRLQEHQWLEGEELPDLPFCAGSPRNSTCVMSDDPGEDSTLEPGRASADASLEYSRVEDQGLDEYSVRVKGERLLVRRVPPGGDSLFLALAHQLHGLDFESPCLQERAAELRAQAVAHLREHVQVYWDALLDSAEKHGDRYADEQQDEEAVVGRYLRDLATPGFPAGPECLAALAELLAAEVAVYVRRAGRHLVRSVDQPAARRLVLRQRPQLLESGSLVGHFDSVIEVAPACK